MLTYEGEVVCGKNVIPFGNSTKVDVQKRYIWRRAYIMIFKE
jgi:putative transposon-encoded protein